MQTQRVSLVFGAVVGFLAGGPQGSGLYVSLPDGKLLRFGLEQYRDTELVGGKICPKESGWSDMNVLHEGDIIAIHLTPEGNTDWWHWPARTLPRGWWTEPMGLSPEEKLFQVSIKAADHERGIFMGSWADLLAFLTANSPIEPGKLVVKVLRYDMPQSVGLGTWDEVPPPAK